MAEIKEFVVNDRRKFTAEGELRPDAPPSEPRAPRPETITPPAPPPDQYNSSARLNGPQAVPDRPIAAESGPSPDGPDEPDSQLPPPLSAEQSAQAQQAFAATVDRLDTAIRAANPGMERIPEMTFERVIQSLYMQAIFQLGGAAAPGQEPQLDLLGARNTIDMLTAIASKTTGNLTQPEQLLVDNALFELRMGFLEVTQAIGRQAAAQQKQSGPPAPSGPSIVR